MQTEHLSFESDIAGISSQMIAGYQTLYFGYDWYLSGGLKNMTYPSGKKVEYAMDDAGRNTKVSTTGKTYWGTTGVSQPFMADGRVKQAMLGNELWDTYDYSTPWTSTIYSLGTTQGGDERIRNNYQYQLLGSLSLPIYLFSGGVSARNRWEQAADNYSLGGSWVP